MICVTCREAAALAHGGQPLTYQELWSGNQETLSPGAAALKVHGGCRGGTWCDCQHALPRAQVPRGT